MASEADRTNPKHSVNAPTKKVTCNIHQKNIYLVSLLLVLCSIPGIGQNRICKEASMIIKTAEKFHYQPRAVDNNFSELVYDGFIKLLDPYSLYLSSNELSELEEAKYSIDDDILNQRCLFVQKANDVFRNALNTVDSLLISFENSVFDYTADDILTATRGGTIQTEMQREKQWKSIIKYQVLSLYFAENDTLIQNKEQIAKRLHELKKVVIKRAHCRIQSKISFDNGPDEYVGSLFLKAVSMAFDPHTLYLSEAEQQRLNGSLSKQAKSFGFYLSRNELAEIEIVNIVPGSPAWKSNALNEGDVILKVTTAEAEMDFSCIGLKEAEDFLASESATGADFLIKKKSGKEISISLEKEEIEVRENVIQSFILTGKAKTGYIYLPSFYSQSALNYYNFKGCANDVAKELIRLKREGISGLILDLRDNGGGSMLEAMLLSGLFIDYGALSISQTRGKEPLTMKDMNRGTIYDGPLVVLINNYSASASELFAAAMQDHNRAVIVGEKSFGKSTMQSIVPVDAYKYHTLDSYRGTPTGFLKLTHGAFYRVTGNSFQQEGVIPDIVLPSTYPDDKTGERSYPSSLTVDRTNKKTYYNPLPELPVQTLHDLSRARLMHDSGFTKLAKQNTGSLQNGGPNGIPLEFEAFKKNLHKMINLEQPPNVKSFEAAYPGYIQNINVFESQKIDNPGMISRIEGDIYIGEAYAIMNDLIDINEK